MSGAANRSARAIDPITREVAERMARQAGLSLTEWIASLEASEAKAAMAQTTGPLAPRASAYLESPRPGSETPARYEAPDHPADELSRVTHAIERLSRRLEDAEDRAATAIVGVDNSVRGAIERLDGEEREQSAVAARLENAVQSICADHTRLADRLKAIEDEAHGPRSVEALRSLESALGKVAGHLYEGVARSAQAIAEVGDRIDKLQSEGAQSAASLENTLAGLGARLEEAEGRTHEALRQLQTSFAALDGRLVSVEGEVAGGAADLRLEQLADDLSSRLETARKEMDSRLRATAEGRIDQLEQALAQMADHIETGERRSAEAIERLGREVVEMSGALTRRVQGAETRGATAIEQVGADVTRIAQAVETKLDRADTIHAQTLEKLGGEIARISERLAERIANSDRRAALAIDEVGEQVVRSSERFSLRQERVSEDLAERIRQSEERTARVLEEARERLERLAAARQAEEAARLAEASPPEPSEEQIFGDDPFLTPSPDVPVASLPPPPYEVEPGADPEIGLPAFTQEDLDAADSFHASLLPEASEEQTGFGLRDEARPLAMDTPPPQTRSGAWSVVQKARAAVGGADQDPPNGFVPRDSAPAEGVALFSHRFSRPGSRPGSGNVVLGMGMAAAVGLAMGGFWFVEGAPRGVLPTALANLTGVLKGPAPGATAPQAPQSLPQEAEALGPMPAGQPAGLARLPAAASDLSPRYAAAVADVEAGNPQGIDSLRRVANLGFPPAEFYLAKLYESGADGLKKDPSEARRWTQRAADGGESKAMHNLALYYFEGMGGPRDTTLAADWFRRAAERGLADSQFNLGRLYEQGTGVPRNPAEAYKWYTIAARSGDAESRGAAARLGAALTPEARIAAERSAAAFHSSGSAAPAALASAPSQTAAGSLVTVQKALLALGYYQGPADGEPSPALRLALSAYQQDQGLAPSGTPDAATVAKLSVLSR